MSIKDQDDWNGLERVGRVAAETLEAMRVAVAPGLTTAELDAIGRAVLDRHGARSAPQLVYRFPGTNCISLNDEVVHGVPGRRAIRPGEVVKLDVTAELPRHFAESMTTLGFDLALGEQLPMDDPPPPTKAQQKQRAKAHAKTVRKERRGERRTRGRK